MMTYPIWPGERPTNYQIGQVVDEFDGRPLSGGHPATCLICGPTRFETRAADDPHGRPLEMEVCQTCRRVQRVQFL